MSQLDVTNEEHPIAFASKELAPKVKNYSAIEQEALAIVKGVKHFRTCSDGNHFTMQTDHNPLTHLSNLKDSHGRLARWVLSLQHYQLKIVYRNGKANANTDSLSGKHNAAFKFGGGSEPLGEDHLPIPATLPSLPEEVELAATDMRATVNTEEDQRENDYKNVVTSGYRVLPQNKHVDRQELIIKLIINNHGNSYSNNKT